MPEERLDERTEPATPRRRREARERGHVARSADLASAVILLGAVLALEFTGRSVAAGLRASVSGVLGGLAEIDGGPQDLVLRFGGAMSSALLGLIPFAVVLAGAAAGIHLLQVGFLWTAKPLAPQLERLDPVEGFRRIFSGRSLVRLLGGLLKAGAVAAVVLLTLWAERERLVGLSGVSFEDALKYGANAVFVLSLRAALALLGLGLLDYGYQRWQYERDLRMSRAEVREELKRYEGDPRVRDRRRQVQRQLALQRMLLRVPQAAIVVADPARLAVALEYDPQKETAPVVAAKGAEGLARRILETALEHAVPVVERPDLARALYRKVEVGGTVPEDLFEDVAEVVAYAYRLKNLAAAA
jgi:flagellar biosynthetic protein FlhB